ncbi:MAG: TIGR03936 family radical SAM-associated protein [Caldilineaceae bacterium]|nr:TIGR03936 family radical SAM-associated protein [Caldilineaceae bacterium]
MPDQETDSQHEPQRLRVVYSRGEALRFISHQDEFRMWERALRRTMLPVAYKQGFNPQPHIQFAAPLAVGCCGRAEHMDFRLSERMPVVQVESRLGAKLPPGVSICSMQEIPVKSRPLQGLLIGAEYRIRVMAPETATGPQAVHEFLARGTVWRKRERKGHPYRYNLKPLVHRLAWTGFDAAGPCHNLLLRVQMVAGATGRPDEVIDELGLSEHALVLERTRLYFANEPDTDVAFPPDTLASQADVRDPHEPPRPPRRQRGRGHRRKQKGDVQPQQKVQSFSEKAADEFR